MNKSPIGPIPYAHMTPHVLASYRREIYVAQLEPGARTTSNQLSGTEHRGVIYTYDWESVINDWETS